MRTGTRERTLHPRFLLPLLSILRLQAAITAGPLAGQVINRTLSRPAAGVEVTLVRHGEGDATVVRDTTDREGRFRFEVDAATEALHTMLSAAYAGVDYRHPEVEVGGAPIQLSVYETTGVDTAVALVSHHIVVDAGAGEVTQILIVENHRDRTYRTAGDHGHGLEVNLPEGVTDIAQGPQGLHTHGSLLIDPRPVEPGASQLAFSFRLPPTGSLVQEVRYPTGSVDVLVTPPDVPATGAALQDLGEVTLGERRFRRFSGTALNPGDRITLQIGSAGPADWLSRDTLKWTLGGLALAFLLLAIFFRPQKKREEVPQEHRETNLQGRRTALLEQIADLDDRLADGELSEGEHRTRREALMAEVVALTRALDTEG